MTTGIRCAIGATRAMGEVAVARADGKGNHHIRVETGQDWGVTVPKPGQAVGD
jgi:hypothetical protein